MRLQGRIQFTGGEPLLSGDLFEILDEARKRDMPARILSNGTLVTRETARMIKETGCRVVQVSLDGNRQTHNAIRGDLAYEKAMEGIKVLKEAGISVTVMMTISGDNYKQLNSVYSSCLEAAADRFSISRLIPIGRGETANRLSKNQTKEMFKAALVLKSENRIEMPLRDPLWGSYFKKANPRLISGCSIGYNGICIDSDGTVYPCRRLPVALGNIMDDDFDNIYNCEQLNQLRNRDAMRGKCGRCRHRWQCGGCRAAAFAANGDYMEEDPQCFI